MRHNLLLLGLIGAVALAVSPAQVFAGDCVAPISWGMTQAYETNYNNNESAANSILTLVGTVNCFSGVFDDIDPNAGTEYSVYVFGCVSQGTAVSPPLPNGTTAYQTLYDNGGVQIWEDPNSDAVFTPNPPNADVPSTFANGTLFLEGDVHHLNVTFFLDTITGDYVQGNFDSGDEETAIWIGGSHFERVSVEGRGCPLRLTGGWNVSPGALVPGFTADVEGKIDTDCPTQAQDTSWGRLKSLYH
jgi:hypothetical protein